VEERPEASAAALRTGRFHLLTTPASIGYSFVHFYSQVDATLEVIPLRRSWGASEHAIGEMLQAVLPLFAVLASLAFEAPPFGANVTLAQAEAAQELAERFAPIAYLREQSGSCDRDGEAYFPAPVETVLGNPEVALKPAEGGQIFNCCH
jgi:hypothetical protein